ncbi:MAG: carbonic anhydrase [Syntrophomonadaceae bacterium]
MNQRPENITPDFAQQLLLEGNGRFVAGNLVPRTDLEARRKDLFAKGQKPFAVILTCSDSRVPPEILFDQGLGDIFVIRVAGNVVDSLAMGSLEYGAEHLQAPLLVVLGHSRCGAVKASVDGGEAPGSIGTIVDKLKPLVDSLKADGLSGDELCQKVEDENISATIREIEKSPVIHHLVDQGKLKVIGAKYCLDSGKVSFFP